MSLYDELAKQSRRKMLTQISITDRLIRQLYIRAAKAIGRQIESAKAGSLTERWLIAYKAELEKEIDRLSQGIYTLIEDGARKAAEAAAECDAEYLRRVAEAAGIDDSFTSTLASVPTDALRAMLDGKLYTDGRMLSSRIWSATGRLEGNIAEIIQQGVAQKMDALTLARHLEAYVNPKAACPVSWHKLYPGIPFDRKVDYNALRLARTSITHAHWAANKAAAKKNPLCRGMKWNLSASHYERQVAVAGEDVCDEYALHDEGLGIGVWPIDDLPMPHPQCLCYQTEVVPDLEEAAELLSKWHYGDGTNAALDRRFEQWQKENAEELDNWCSEEEVVKRTLDNSGEFATMDTDKLARALLSEPIIDDAKIYRFMLNPEQKHYRDFVEAGYSQPEDGERLRADILSRCAETSVFEDIRIDDQWGGVRFEKYIRLGSEGHRFKVAFKIDEGSAMPRLLTCYRKEDKHGTV